MKIVYEEKDIVAGDLYYCYLNDDIEETNKVGKTVTRIYMIGYNVSKDVGNYYLLINMSDGLINYGTSIMGYTKEGLAEVMSNSNFRKINISKNDLLWI